eukprot:920545_1
MAVITLKAQSKLNLIRTLLLFIGLTSYSGCACDFVVLRIAMEIDQKCSHSQGQIELITPMQTRTITLNELDKQRHQTETMFNRKVTSTEMMNDSSENQMGLHDQMKLNPNRLSQGCIRWSQTTVL